MNYIRSVFTVFLIAVLISSCSKSDDASTPVQADLSGTWRVTSYYFDGRVSSQHQETFSYYDYTGNAGKMNLIMVFTESLNYSFDGFYFLDNTILTDEGDFYQFTDYHTVTDDGTYTLDSNNISLVVDGEEINIGEIS